MLDYFRALNLDIIQIKHCDDMPLRSSFLLLFTLLRERDLFSTVAGYQVINQNQKPKRGTEPGVHKLEPVSTTSLGLQTAGVLRNPILPGRVYERIQTESTQA